MIARFAPFAILACVAMTNVAQAQDVAETSEIFEVHAPEPQGLHEALSTYIQLQKDFYANLTCFEERAETVLSYLREFESLQIVKKQISFETPEVEWKETPDWVRIKNIVTAEPTVCAEVDQAIASFIDANAPVLRSVVNTLIEQTKRLDETQKMAFAQTIRDAFRDVPEMNKIRQLMAMCVYKQRNEAGGIVNYSVEKKWRTWYHIQKPLLDAWLSLDDF